MQVFQYFSVKKKLIAGERILLVFFLVSIFSCVVFISLIFLLNWNYFFKNCSSLIIVKFVAECRTISMGQGQEYHARKLIQMSMQQVRKNTAI